MTFPFVPGGPEPSRNGFSNFIPLTVIDRSAVTLASEGVFGKEGRISQAPRAIQPAINRERMSQMRWLVLLAGLGGCDSGFGVHRIHSGEVTADAPIDAPPGMGWKQVAAGAGHVCGIRAD